MSYKTRSVSLTLKEAAPYAHQRVYSLLHLGLNSSSSGKLIHPESNPMRPAGVGFRVVSQSCT